MPDASKASLEGFLEADLARPATLTTDAFTGYRGLADAGYRHEPITLTRSWGDASQRLPAIHLVFGLVERWLSGTRHGAAGKKHLRACLDAYLFPFNRRTAESPAHRSARPIQQALQSKPTTYRQIVQGTTAWGLRRAGLP